MIYARKPNWVVDRAKFEANSDSAVMTPSPTEILSTDRLVLTPLQVSDAYEMVLVLADLDLYAYTGGEPPSFEDLNARYQAQVDGSGSEEETWHNWIIRIDSSVAVGFVQATVAGRTADIAWVVGSRWQRNGYASEAARAMCQWLYQGGVARTTAHVHPDHTASSHVATAAGLVKTDEIDKDGEVVWISPERGAGADTRRLPAAP